MTFEDFTIVPNSTDPRFHDLVGRTYSHLTVVGHLGIIRQYRTWLCQCSCGNFVAVSARNLRRKGRKSCGCQRNAFIQASLRTHGLAKTPTHNAWLGMWGRVRSKRPEFAPNYRDRGITVCERWRKFENFLEDMGEKPSSAHSLDRIDNDKGYSPDNCRWATIVEQMNNTRHNHFLEFNGKRLSLAQWERETGLKASILSKRIRKGWTVEKALTTPPRPIFWGTP